MAICASLVAAMLVGCGSIYWNRGSSYVTNIETWGEYDMDGKTFYVEPGDQKVHSSDPEFREYVRYLVEDLKLQGAKEIFNKQNADVCILMNYGIADQSYIETVPVPIIGRTGISSIYTTSSTDWSARGSAYSWGGYTTASASGSSTTRSNTSVTYDYGVVGYGERNVRVDKFYRYVNIYAFDNKTYSSEPQMLWKANLASSGTNSNFRQVVPYMFFTALYQFGSGTRKQSLVAFSDDHIYDCWKGGGLSSPRVNAFPYYRTSSVSGLHIQYIEKLPNETIICISKDCNGEKYSVIPETYILFNGQRVKLSRLDGGELNETYKNEYGRRYFRMHFPVGISHVYSFDLVEHVLTDSYIFSGVSAK